MVPRKALGFSYAREDLSEAFGWMRAAAEQDDLEAVPWRHLLAAVEPLGLRAVHDVCQRAGCCGGPKGGAAVAGARSRGGLWGGSVAWALNEHRPTA